MAKLLSSHLNELSAHNLLYQLLLAAGEEGDVGGREGGDVGGGEGGRQAVQGGGSCRVDGRALNFVFIFVLHWRCCGKSVTEGSICISICVCQKKILKPGGSGADVERV